MGSRSVPVTVWLSLSAWLASPGWRFSHGTSLGAVTVMADSKLSHRHDRAHRGMSEYLKSPRALRGSAAANPLGPRHLGHKKVARPTLRRLCSIALSAARRRVHRQRTKWGSCDVLAQVPRSTRLLRSPELSAPQSSGCSAIASSAASATHTARLRITAASSTVGSLAP